MRDFNWNLVKAFLAVVDSGTLSAAADKLGTSQPTLGRQITELEEVCGFALFVRGRGGMRLTEAGARLVDSAREMQSDAGLVALAVSGNDTALSGTVRLTASQIMANFVLPDILRDFRQAEPGIQVELVSSNTVDNLLARDADLAIRMTRPVQNDLIARQAATFGMGAYAHVAYINSYGAPSAPDDFKAHTLIGYDRDDLILRAMKEFGIAMDRTGFALRSDDQVACWHLLKAGAGVGFAPRIMGDREPNLRRLFRDWPIPALPVWIAAHQELRSNPRIRRTADFLHDALKALPLNPD